MLTSSISRYQILNEIGKGSYGIVYRAEDLENHSIVALKKLQIRNSQGGYSNTLLREVSLLRQITHPNIVSIKDFFSYEESDYITFEYLNFDLRNFMNAIQSRLPEQAIKFYMHQILTGLRFCHENYVIHRDLKPQNLLLSNEEVKIADFGLSKVESELKELGTPFIQTLWYRAPEIILGDKCTEKIDLWSVGCIFAEMVSGKPIFPGGNSVDQLWKIFELLGTPEESSWQEISALPGFHIFPKFEKKDLKSFFPELSVEGLDFLLKLLALNPSKRMSSQEALGHVYLREFRYKCN